MASPGSTVNGPRVIFACASRSSEACCCSVHESPPQQSTWYPACSSAHLTGAVWFSFAYAKMMTFIRVLLFRHIHESGKLRGYTRLKPGRWAGAGSLDHLIFKPLDQMTDHAGTTGAVAQGTAALLLFSRRPRPRPGCRK